MDIICYEIKGTCYYVTGAQDRVLQKFSGAKKDKFIKKTSFARGKLGEPIKNSEGSLAIIYPEGRAPEKLIDPNAPPSDEVEESEEVEEPEEPTEPASVKPVPVKKPSEAKAPAKSLEALTSLLGEGGVHP